MSRFSPPAIVYALAGAIAHIIAVTTIALTILTACIAYYLITDPFYLLNLIIN